MDTLWDYLASVNFMPHGHCFLWRKDLLFLHVGSDLFIAAAYMMIPAGLLKVAKSRTDLSFKPIYVLFILFIFFCGCTHILDTWNIWNSDYYFEGMLKAITATVSVLTALALWRNIEAIIALPSPQALKLINDSLQSEIEKRKKVEQHLIEARASLEEKVVERTKSLDLINMQLKQEVAGKSTAQVQFQTLFEASPSGIVVVDEDGIIQLANQKAHEFFTVDKSSLCNRNIEDLVPMRNVEEHMKMRAHYMENPTKRQMGQLRDVQGKRLDGSTFSASIALTPITSLQGVKQVIATIVDLTEQRTQHMLLKQRNDALHQSNLELEQFAFVASHDLREPLRKIISFGKLLTSGNYGQMDEKGVTFLGYMCNAAERMTELLDHLLDYSRITSRAKPFMLESLDQLLQIVLQDLELRVNENNVHVEVKGTLPSIYCDGAQIRQLFQNIIDNAIKYRSTESPRITISIIESDREWITLCVKDNGIGFMSDFSEQIFEVFKRLHSRQAYPGTGMGLAICKKIVQRHGGSIKAEGEEGGGAAFFITLSKDSRSINNEKSNNHSNGG